MTRAGSNGGGGINAVSTFRPATVDRPALSLDAPIIVLAHPRTGSSLLMQTLGLLGAPMIGTQWREDCPRSANPRGYFEDPDLRAFRFTARNRERLGARLNGSAYKLGLKRLTDSPDREDWDWMIGARTTLLIPLRHPLESALSERALFHLINPPDPTETNGVRGFVAAARCLARYMGRYAFSHFRLAEMMAGEAASLAKHCRFVPYTLHRHPRRYVDTVCERAGLTPVPDRVERAVGNIAPSLHRFRESDLPAVYRNIYNRSPARPVFETLSRHDGIGTWTSLLRLRERGSD